MEEKTISLKNAIFFFGGLMLIAVLVTWYFSYNSNSETSDKSLFDEIKSLEKQPSKEEVIFDYSIDDEEIKKDIESGKSITELAFEKYSKDEYFLKKRDYAKFLVYSYYDFGKNFGDYGESMSKNVSDNTKLLPVLLEGLQFCEKWRDKINNENSEIIKKDIVLKKYRDLFLELIQLNINFFKNEVDNLKLKNGERDYSERNSKLDDYQSSLNFNLEKIAKLSTKLIYKYYLNGEDTKK